MAISSVSKVLITGGQGFLGARIGGTLASEGYIVALGSRNPELDRPVNGCSHVYTNWDDPDLKFCQNYDVIIHAAGMNASDCIDNPNQADYVNRQLSGRICEKAAKNGCKRFFYLSTVHVYKSPLIGNFNEASPILNPHPYASSHYLGERAVLACSEKYSMRVHVLRLSNCFGYPLIDNADCWKLVLNEFVRDSIFEEKITIRGNPFERRDFLSIGELTRIFLDLLGSAIEIPKLLNVTSGVSRTLTDAANSISEIIGEQFGTTVSVERSKSVGVEGDLAISNDSLKKIGITPRSELCSEIKALAHFININV